MLSKKKLTVGFAPAGHRYGDITPFDSVFTHKKCITDGLKGIDCLLLWGGTDIHPSYYGDVHHKYSGAPALPSDRDVMEWNAMKWCKAHGIPMIGVCRGAQFGCAFSGGTLAQDVRGHGYHHIVETSDGRKIWVTSTHHQMMNPYSVEHELLAWTDIARADSYPDGHGDEMVDLAYKDEPEIVYFPETKFLAIQGHPEYGDATKEFQDYCVELVKTYLFKEHFEGLSA